MTASTKIKLKVLAFGITKDILGASSIQIDLERGATVLDLKTHLIERFPAMKALNSLLIAVNNEYGDENLELKEGDDIALIPPVSGG